MNKAIQIVLKKIETAGFEAYIVGGYVRDSLLGMTSLDIDIATEAPIESLKKIFVGLSYHIKFHSFSFAAGDCFFEITPYRKEGPYLTNRRPSYIEEVPTIKEDSKRRDFTMNALYMNKQAQIRSFHSGLKDIANRVIRCVGNPRKRLEEDPLRILRALRFSVVLDFQIEERLSKAIVEKRYLLHTLSYTRKKEELSKMMEKSVEKALLVLKEHNLYGELDIPDDILATESSDGFWVQIAYREYPFTKEEMKRLYSLQTLLESDLEDVDLFYAKEEELKIVCMIRELNWPMYQKRWEELPIHKVEDVALDVEFLKKNNYSITSMKEKMIAEILAGKLDNQSDKIRQYITKNYNN